MEHRASETAPENVRRDEELRRNEELRQGDIGGKDFMVGAGGLGGIVILTIVVGLLSNA